MKELYVVPPPPSLASLSVTTAVADAESAMIRSYKAWKGSNIFFLRGRLIFGPDADSIILTVFLVVAPVAIFCVFVARKLLDEFSHHFGILVMVVVIVLTLLDIVFLLLTSSRDPGIIPRNKQPPEPEAYEEASGLWVGQTPPLRLPRSKEVIVNGISVKVKYCDTCMLYRPPRCSHCSICNNCVEKFDHHCPWVGQCIGLRNYRFYFMFVFSATLLCLYVHGFCWVYIKMIMNGERISIWKAMVKTPASIALLIYSFFAIWFVGGLTVFHSYLISTNQSTYENFRYRYDRGSNPYNRGVIENIKEAFLTRIPLSKNNFREKVPKEPEILPRIIGGSFGSSNMSDITSDRERGSKRKPIWDEVTRELGGNEQQLSSSNLKDKNLEFTDLSSSHRHGSAGIYALAAEIEESKWIAGGSSSNSPSEIQ